MVQVAPLLTTKPPEMFQTCRANHATHAITSVGHKTGYDEPCLFEVLHGSYIHPAPPHRRSPCPRFANTAPAAHNLSWDEFVSFLVNARVVTPERATRLHPLLNTEPQAVDAVLLKVLRLRESSVPSFFRRREKALPQKLGRTINDLLRLTKATTNSFPARRLALGIYRPEGGLEWLLAAIARSAAELLVEGPNALSAFAPIPRAASSL